MCYAHPGLMETASSRRKRFTTQHVHCTPCAKPQKKHQQAKTGGPGQGPGQRPGTEERADARAPGEHPRARTRDRWQPTGPVGLHANSVTSHINKALLPCYIAWSGQLLIHNLVDTRPHYTILGCDLDSAPAMCDTMSQHND